MSAAGKLTTRVSTKGQVILPKAIRERLRWSTGTELIVEETPEGVLLKGKPAFCHLTARGCIWFSALSWAGKIDRGDECGNRRRGKTAACSPSILTSLSAIWWLTTQIKPKERGTSLTIRMSSSAPRSCWNRSGCCGASRGFPPSDALRLSPTSLDCRT
jgi:AbrB family looped-hinge helix DNA binding protein